MSDVELSSSRPHAVPAATIGSNVKTSVPFFLIRNVRPVVPSLFGHDDAL